jgi:UDP-N-acetylglucosamine diphosphorylase/glucosamine-1-phosphate N-acetyltransferase
MLLKQIIILGMNVILFDQEAVWKNLLPLTFTRPVSEIRIGILTIKQKWDVWLKTTCSYSTQKYLTQKFPLSEKENSLFIASNVCPDIKLLETIAALKPKQALVKNNKLIAFIGASADIDNLGSLSKTEISFPVFEINNTWEIFQKNAEAIASDFEILTSGKKSQAISSSVTIIGDKNLVFFEAGAKAEACILNTTTGPIYIGKDAEIMEGSAIRGPFALCEHSTLKLNTKIYGATTIGPECKVGGEVSNCVIFGYSNKAHDGFIGNSVIGEWCNLGADTNSSNLKNNYGSIKLFNYAQNKSIDSGLQFCGLIMGDYSKSGINTMFNTGTVVGVGANIFGGGFPVTHIPAFSWGGAQGFETYKQEKLFETSEKVFERRALKFGDTEKNILNEVFKLTTEYRND